jgi:hypothetical protein
MCNSHREYVLVASVLVTLAAAVVQLADTKARHTLPQILIFTFLKMFQHLFQLENSRFLE